MRENENDLINRNHQIKISKDDEMIELLEKLAWWNLSISKIQKLIPLLSNNDINYVKEEIKRIINGNA